MNIFRRVYNRITYRKRLSQSWFAPYVNHPPLAAIRCRSVLPCGNTSLLEMTTEQALGSLLDAYAPLENGPSIITHNRNTSYLIPE